MEMPALWLISYTIDLIILPYSSFKTFEQLHYVQISAERTYTLMLSYKFI